jgi:uncharacterized protein (DUF1330 family)
MSAYVVASYNVTDPEKIGRYVQGTIPTIMKHGGEVLVAGGQHEDIEGERHAVVVLRFDSLEAAHAWHNDSDYQSVIHLRHEASENGHLAIADAFKMPA